MALLKEDVPDQDRQKYCGSRFLFFKRNIVNSFLHDAFSSVARFAERCFPSTIQGFLQESILFHHKIKVDWTFLSRQVWQKLNVVSIGQLMNENFEFVEYIYFATKFGNDKFSGILSSNKSF